MLYSIIEINLELNPKSTSEPAGNQIGKFEQLNDDSEAAAEDVFPVPTAYLLDFKRQISEVLIFIDITHSFIVDDVHDALSPFKTLSTFHTFPVGTVEFVFTNLT
jgi:hypothetical protein